MTRAPVEAPYSFSRLQQMLGLSRSTLAGLIDAGFVTPGRGPRNSLRFSFQDVVLLRTAHHLQAAGIAPRRIVRSLQRLQAQLPTELPLTGLRITAVGNDVAVRDGPSRWLADSGQLLMDFDVTPSQGAVAFLQRSTADAPAATTAADWFARGQTLEATDPDQAEAAYRHAIELAPDDAGGYLNLGALLCEARRCDEALNVFAQALRHCPDDAGLHFNQAIALEDQGSHAAALLSYERCLALSSEFADAHYNAARLYEQQGQTQKALRHYSAYRRLQR